MKLDIYKISRGNEGKGSIRAVLNPILKKRLKESLKNLSVKGDLRKFCKELGISYFTFWDYFNRRAYVPLFVLEKLEKTRKDIGVSLVSMLLFASNPHCEQFSDRVISALRPDDRGNVQLMFEEVFRRL